MIDIELVFSTIIELDVIENENLINLVKEFKKNPEIKILKNIVKFNKNENLINEEIITKIDSFIQEGIPGKESLKLVARFRKHGLEKGENKEQKIDDFQKKEAEYKKDLELLRIKVMELEEENQIKDSKIKEAIANYSQNPNTRNYKNLLEAAQDSDLLNGNSQKDLWEVNSIINHIHLNQCPVSYEDLNHDIDDLVKDQRDKLIILSQRLYQISLFFGKKGGEKKAQENKKKYGFEYFKEYLESKGIDQYFGTKLARTWEKVLIKAERSNLKTLQPSKLFHVLPLLAKLEKSDIDESKKAEEIKKTINESLIEQNKPMDEFKKFILNKNTQYGFTHYSEYNRSALDLFYDSIFKKYEKEEISVDDIDLLIKKLTDLKNSQ